MAGTVKFLKDRRGAAAAEFALVALVFAVMLVAILDFGRGLWEYNRAVKACQFGVRFAVVNDMVPSGLAAWSGVIDGGFAGGTSIPVAAINPSTVVCDSTGCTPPPVSPNDWGYDADAYDAIVQRMAGYYPPLSANPNAVTVTYEHIGMGFAGNPFGPDVWPLTTVEITGITFQFFTPFITAANIQFPECTATLTGEDFTT